MDCCDFDFLLFLELQLELFVFLADAIELWSARQLDSPSRSAGVVADAQP
jgi:hypothetical protein